MFTLKNLHEATEQQVFDQAVTHLLTQNEKSLSNTSEEYCLYRSPKGLKCGAGCFIADDEYDAQMETKLWHFSPHHAELIRDLQVIHDRFNVAYWPHKLIQLANEEGLEAQIVFDMQAKLNKGV